MYLDHIIPIVSIPIVHIPILSYPIGLFVFNFVYRYVACAWYSWYFRVCSCVCLLFRVMSYVRTRNAYRIILDKFAYTCQPMAGWVLSSVNSTSWMEISNDAYMPQSVLATVRSEVRVTDIGTGRHWTFGPVDVELSFRSRHTPKPCPPTNI